jgi:hypothetical protein
MTTHVDSETIAIWGDAMCAALNGDRSELVDLLRHNNKVTRDLAEFLAYLLEERKKGRPRLPAKFGLLYKMAHNPRLWDAFLDFEMQRANWYGVMPFPPYEKTNKKRFPFEMTLKEVADRWNLHTETLRNAVRRNPKSGKRIAG